MGKQKAPLDLVKMVLQRNALDVRAVSKILEDLHLELDNEVDDKPPPIKKQFVILQSEATRPDQDPVAWALQIPEGESPYSVTEKLLKAGYEFNMTPKGRKLPVKTIGEICESVPARLLKEQNIWVKTKEPVFVIATDNSMPFES